MRRNWLLLLPLLPLVHMMKQDPSSAFPPTLQPELLSLLTSTPPVSKKKPFWLHCKEQFSTTPTRKGITEKKLFTDVLSAQFHPARVPVVWENLFSYFLPSELVPVSHLEVESFPEPPQPTGAVTPKGKATNSQSGQRTTLFLFNALSNWKKKGTKGCDSQYFNN